jgi:hypothetical protein
MASKLDSRLASAAYEMNFLYAQKPAERRANDEALGRTSACTFFRILESLSVIPITPQVMTHLPSPFVSMSAFLRSAQMQEHQATLRVVSLTGYLLHTIAAPNDDGALLAMRIILLAT